MIPHIGVNRGGPGVNRRSSVVGVKSAFSTISIQNATETILRSSGAQKTVQDLKEFISPALGALYSRSILIWSIINSKEISTGGEWCVIQNLGSEQVPKD